MKLVYMSMSVCLRCGVTFHPELPKCPVCGQVRAREANKRRKLWYLTNTILVSFVAVVVGVRAITGGEIQVGMSDSDCSQARVLAEETRYALESLSSDQERAIRELQEVSLAWSNLAGNYVPGKYSWSTSGREHNWLERLAISTSQLATGGQVNVEEVDNPVKYVSELTRLYPRFCS